MRPLNAAASARGFSWYVAGQPCARVLRSFGVFERERDRGELLLFSAPDTAALVSCCRCLRRGGRWS
jgi:hypothetical protein